METTRTISCSKPDAVLPIRILSDILQVAIDFTTIEQDGQKLALELKVTKTNPFAPSLEQTTYFRGITSIVRELCQNTCLWNGSTSSIMDGQLGSWLETGMTELGTVAYMLSDEQVKDPLFAKQVLNYADNIESHFLSTSNTYLLDTPTPTAADIVTAILLSQAAKKTQTELCEQTHRFVETILRHTVVNLVDLVPKLSTTRKVEVSSKSAPKKTDDTKKAKKDDKSKKVDNPKKADMVKSAPPEKAVNAEKVDSAGGTAANDDEEFASNPIILKLKELQIPYTVYKHTQSNTVDELLTNVPLPSSNETHTKNLLLKDKKHGLFLLTVKTDANTRDTKAIGKLLNLTGKINLRFADEATLDKTLKCPKGCVGPLAVLNDIENGATLVLDEALMKCDKIHSHPLRNDASVAVKPSDLINYVKKCGKEPIMVEFERAGDNEKPVAGAKTTAPPVKGGKKGKPQPKKKDPSAPKTKNMDKKTSKKGETLLALQWKKKENFPMWYSDVIVLSEMISYYNISGCYILRPWSYKIWDLMQVWFNGQIQSLGVENCYFPLFVSKDRLEKEKDHVEGFAAEVAWVTKSGDGDLAMPIAVRPTSETIMYPAFSDWIKSHRDLPLKLNQWSNVVRWEFKDPTPFLRSREFLWQEGHTAHATFDEANEMVMQALDLYRRVYEELLAVPVIPGYKTEKEKFAGGDRTTTVEAYIPQSGRAIQGATSHHLGQNFGKMFEIKFQNEAGKSEIAWQTSWGLTTRTIGVMVMVHGDDVGLVLPPAIAPLQCVIVPIISKHLTDEDAKEYCEGILADLVANGIRAKYDDRTMYNPGWKYNHWEQKGVPIRIEVGPRDIEKQQVRTVIRSTGEKIDEKIDGLGALLNTKLGTIQVNMLQAARKTRDEHLVQVTEWKDFVPNLEKSNMVLTPWCGGEHQDWEEWVKNKSREESLAEGEEEDAQTATSVAAKTLCIPFTQPDLPKGTKCIASGMDATCWVLWGRSY